MEWTGGDQLLKIVNIGVIGCGAIGPQHMQTAVELDHTNLVAVADIDETRARQAAEKYGAADYYTDPMALLDNANIHAVVLALPAGLRSDLAVEALRQGKHILIEKPPARNLAEFDKMAAVAGDCIVACASARYMLMPHSDAVRSFIASGALGEIRSIHFRNLLPPGPPPTAPPPGWRVSREIGGGGVMVNLSSYDLDYILGMTGWTLKPRHVLARWWPIAPQFANYVAPGSDADEHFTAYITCDNGTAIYLERGERVAGAPESSMRIVGANGSMKLSHFPDDEKRVVCYGLENGAGEKVIWEGKEDWSDTRIGILDDFARAIIEERQPQTGLKRARILQQLFDAVYTSSDENRPVEIH